MCKAQRQILIYGLCYICVCVYFLNFCTQILLLKSPKEAYCFGFIAHPTREVNLYINVLINF